MEFFRSQTTNLKAAASIEIFFLGFENPESFDMAKTLI
jgi:hypothetical protein